MNNYAVLGDPQTCGHLRQALSRNAMSVLDEGELELQDEWEVRRWFSRNTPEGVFICVGLAGQTSVSNFLFTTGGTLNVIRAAVGNSKRLILISHFPTGEFFLMSRLVDLYHFEKQLDFYSVVRNTTERTEVFADRSVLLMRDVSATQTHQKSSQGPHQGREVRDQVVPQSPGRAGEPAAEGKRTGEGLHRPAGGMLEVPQQETQGAAPGDLRPQLAPADGQKAECALHPNSGPI